MVAPDWLAALKDLYPFASNFLDLGPHRLHYLDEGEGETLLMLHGNPTWSFYYRTLVQGLRHQNRCIVPDHMGCGLSDKPQDYPYTLSTHIDNLEKLVLELGLDDITLVLHDWGGAIGMGFAFRHPEKVRRCVVFNTAAFLSSRIPWRIDVCRNPILGPLAILKCNAFAGLGTWMASRRRGRMTQRVRQGYLGPYQTPADRIAHLRFVQDIPLTAEVPSHAVVKDMQSRLEEFRDRPFLIIWGLQDFCFDQHYLDRWQRYFPEAEVHTIADAGHYVVEDAYEEIIPFIIEFLRRNPISIR
ncbi:MAG: alpha/beta fold hydrolase [Nitrospinaceae bacterium]